MEDIAAKLNQILNSPEGMEQLRSVAASLGLGDNNSPANNFGGGNPNNGGNNFGGNFNGGNNNNSGNNNSSGGLDLSAISSLLSGLGGGNNNQPAPTNNAPSILPNVDLNTIMRLQQAMSQLNTTDKNVELLVALKSHFGSERQKKVDDAIRIMQLVKLLPLIKESGIFGGGLF